MKKRVAICNRGEVAVRIIRTCQELGFASVLLHSTADIDTLAYQIADETFELTGNTALETYLNIPVVVAAIQQTGADLVHPGFGFLSENSEFVLELEKAGITFVGPSAKSISLTGNKIKAKELAINAGVPTIPAYLGDTTDPKKLLAEIKKMGFPVIVKAASGGGGKGMKVVHKDSELFELVESAKREAKSAFGSSQVFIEKYLESPRHIEVQILCDKHGNRFHFFERDCSIQRRHQKIFEEAPATVLTPEQSQQITSAALKIAEACDYVNAGTVEFLLDGDKFYFMELNTRLQVEHTVTEMICGVDFVKMQMAVALGDELAFAQDQISPRGHALEVRIYAENPEREFLPSTGEILEMSLPLGPHRRFDFGFTKGQKITAFYDPMIGKVITWAPTREENLKRMHATLSELVIFGVHTNIEFLKAVLENKKYQNNLLNTSFLATEFKNGFTPRALTEEQKSFAKTAKSVETNSGSSLTFRSPWVNS